MSFSSATPDSLQPGMVALLGIPSDENSSFLRGPALAPPRIREVLHAGSMNLCAEGGMDLGATDRLVDLGDLSLQAGARARDQIEAAVSAIVDRDACALSLGGDHAVTYPIVKVYGRKYPNLNILHLDAHPDLYDDYEGNRYSNACPFARVMEENLATRLVQVGIRTMNPHQLEQANRFGIEVVDMRRWQAGFQPAFEGPLYLSLDMDALDPAFAPGVSHHEPGGLSTREVIQLIQGLQAPVLGADLVEFNPIRDPVGITAMAAAKLLKEMAACMLKGQIPCSQVPPHTTT